MSSSVSYQLNYDGTEARETLERAARHLAGVLDECDATDVFCRMTCREADAIAGLLNAADHADTAQRIIAAHARSDNEHDDTHHHLYDPTQPCTCSDMTTHTLSNIPIPRPQPYDDVHTPGTGSAQAPVFSRSETR